MKKINIYIIALISLSLSLSSCIKSDNNTYTGTTELEWDADTYNANAAGVTYPIFTKVPGYGRAQVTADPNITRASGTIKFRVNLVGPQQNSDITVSYVALSPASTAVAGTHYTTSGTFIIPAHTSFGEVTVNIINAGPLTPTTRDLILELVAPAGLKVNPSDMDLGIRIAEN